MKVSSIALFAALAAPATGEIYLKEQFNDKVRRTRIRSSQRNGVATIPTDGSFFSRTATVPATAASSHPVVYLSMDNIPIKTGLE